MNVKAIFRKYRNYATRWFAIFEPETRRRALGYFLSDGNKIGRLKQP